MRLVDADELVLYKASQVDPTRKPIGDGEVNAFRLGGNDAIDAIMKYAPTVDPVKHGQWERYETPNGSVGCECSACKYRITIMEPIYGYPYCPNCGAKMTLD